LVTLTSTVTGTNYTWTATASAATITGFTPSSSNANLQVQTIFNSATAIGTVTYLIKPIFDGCPGDPVSYTVTINPSPQVLFSPTDQTICSGTASAAVTLSSATAGASLSWTCVQPAGITGVATSGTNTIPVQTLVNSTNGPINVTYIANATTAGGTACAGGASNYTITVNPAPQVIFSVTDKTICSGGQTIAVALTSPSSGVSIFWTCAPPAGITGATTTGTTSIPVQTLINTTNAPITVKYIAIATTSGGTACPGSNFTYSITVNPTPDVTATPNTQTICSKSATNIALSSLVSGTSFSWTVSANAAITGASAAGGSSIA
jgi:hypothetical protein